LSITNTTAATSTTSGALTVAGGAGIGGNVFVGGNIGIGTTSTATGDAATVFGGNLLLTGSSNQYLTINGSSSSQIALQRGSNNPIGIISANQYGLCISAVGGFLGSTTISAVNTVLLTPGKNVIIGAPGGSGSPGVTLYNTIQCFAVKVFNNSNVQIGWASVTPLCVGSKNPSSQLILATGDTVNPGGVIIVNASNTAGGNIAALPSGGLSFGSYSGSVGNDFSTPRMQITGTGNVGIGTSTPLALLHIGTGNANVAPLLMTSNAVALTTLPITGAIEFDGNVVYATGSTVTGRGYIPSTQFRRLPANGSATPTTITSYFGSNANVTLVANSVYEVEYNLYFTKNTAGTVTFSFASNNTFANFNASYIGSVSSGGIVTVGTPQMAAVISSTSSAPALPATNSLASGSNFYFNIKAIVETNTVNQPLVLDVTNSAGTVTPLRGSYFKVNRVSTANVGIFT
jgi:hypothetical protein